MRHSASALYMLLQNKTNRGQCFWYVMQRLWWTSLKEIRFTRVIAMIGVVSIFQFYFTLWFRTFILWWPGTLVLLNHFRSAIPHLNNIRAYINTCYWWCTSMYRYEVASLCDIYIYMFQAIPIYMCSRRYLPFTSKVSSLSYFSVVVCLTCLLHHILSLIAYTFRENRQFVFIIIVQFMISENIRFGLQIALVCLYSTPSNYHHCANLSEDIELTKCLSDIFCLMCE